MIFRRCEVYNKTEVVSFLLKIIFNKDLSGFKINITDKSGLRLVNIFKSEDQKIIQQKFYFLMDSLVEREIFIKTEQ